MTETMPTNLTDMTDYINRKGVLTHAEYKQVYDKVMEILKFYEKRLENDKVVEHLTLLSVAAERMTDHKGDYTGDPQFHDKLKRVNQARRYAIVIENNFRKAMGNLRHAIS